MRESDKSFVALVEDLTKIVDLTRQCEVAEEGRYTANYMHDKERAMRMKFEDEAAECRRCVCVPMCLCDLIRWNPIFLDLLRICARANSVRVCVCVCVCTRFHSLVLADALALSSDWLTPVQRPLTNGFL
jgi:hypothetical protein